jgi:tetratricopeptide (TPR) repeat protein
MSLAGNLRTMDLPEILQWISVGRKTGTLHLERRSILKRIVFKQGNIFTSASTDPRESLGQFLLRDRLLTEEQLFKTLLRQEQEGRLLGAIVVSDGLVSEDDLRRILRTKAEETVYDLFHWPEGRFEFKDGETAKGPLIPIDLGVPAVILEGIRRVDEWQRIREVFPSMNTTLTLPRGLPEGVTEPFSRDLLRLAQAGKTLAAIALELRFSEFETAVRAFGLHEQGLLAAAAPGHGEEPAEDPVEATRGLLAEGYQRLMEKRYDKALEAYEQVLALDRLNQNAKKGVVAALEARNRERTLRTVPLDKVPVLKMDLAILTQQDFDPQEGFVLSRVNGQWDVQSILKLCPMKEEEALMIFARLLERGVIDLR